MNVMKKYVILSGMLSSLTAVSLTGCGEQDNTYRVAKTNIEITYENDEVVSGKVPYDDINGHIKVVILEQNGTIQPFLMIREKKAYASDGTTLSYIDLEHGRTLIKYHWINPYIDVEKYKPDSIPIGKSITILEEQKFYGYLFGLGEIRTEFDVSELIEIYHSEVEPELLEYITETYGSYTKQNEK